jgi:hypothetical protein
MPLWPQIVLWLIGVLVYTFLGFIGIAFSVGGASGTFPVGVLVQVLACFGIPAIVSLTYFLKNRPAKGFIWLFSGIPLFVASSMIYIAIYEK